MAKSEEKKTNPSNKATNKGTKSAKPTKASKPAYKLVQKRSGRYAVKGRDGKFINGDAKAEILSKEGVIKGWKPKKEAPATEA